MRLLGPYDPFVQAKDRELLVPEEARRKTLWPVLGRPGAVLRGTDVVGTWRPRMAAKKLILRVEAFEELTTPVRAAVEKQARLLAGFRGAALTGVEFL